MSNVIVRLATVALAGVLSGSAGADETSDNFVRACMAKGGREHACACAHARLRARHGADAYRAFERRLAAGDDAAAREVAAAAAECRAR